MRGLYVSPLANVAKDTRLMFLAALMTFLDCDRLRSDSDYSSSSGLSISFFSDSTMKRVLRFFGWFNDLTESDDMSFSSSGSSSISLTPAFVWTCSLALSFCYSTRSLCSFATLRRWQHFLHRRHMSLTVLAIKMNMCTEAKRMMVPM